MAGLKELVTAAVMMELFANLAKLFSLLLGTGPAFEETV